MTNDAVSILMLAALGLGIPALIGLFAPRRWRALVLIGWILAPVFLLLAMASVEAVQRPGEADMRNLAFGVMLIGSLFAVPWLLACLVGFGLGALLRGRGRGLEAVVAAAPMVPPATIASGDTVGWRVAHVGFERDGLLIDGLDVWALPWRTEGAPPVMLPHPAHPGQMHDFSIYAIDDGATSTRFAAAELSNGVWGFYRSIGRSDAGGSASGDGSLRHVAPDGSLLVERELVEWFNNHWIYTPRVQELATGRILLDLWGSDWDAVPDFPRAKTVRLALESYRSRAYLSVEIDLATGRYSVDGRSDAGPLESLPAFLEREVETVLATRAPSQPVIARTTLRSYGVAALILIVALAAIALASYLTVRLSPPPSPQRLDTVPAMPRFDKREYQR